MSVRWKLYCAIYRSPKGRVNYTNFDSIRFEHFTDIFEFSQKDLGQL